MGTSLFPIYLALRAMPNSHVAGEDDILANIEKSVPSASSHESIRLAAREVSRASGELHNIAAITGGMAAQEIIKIITKQYVPVDNTCVFDGIGSRCQIFYL